MNLDKINEVFNNIKENDIVENFIKQLSNYLEENVKLNNLEQPIIEEILKTNKLTTGNENQIIWNLDEVVEKYAKENYNNEAIYFIKDNKKIYWQNNKKNYDDSFFTALKVENGEVEELEIKKSDTLKNITVNDVIKIYNGEFIVDSIATKELKDEIKKMADDIIEKQNEELNKYRKENHLYIVCEEIGKNRFLKDITEKSDFEFEEVNIDENLLDKVTEGTIIKFEDGKYKYFGESID